jgi:hypothetical protein
MVTSLRLLACLRVARTRLDISLVTDTQLQNTASRRMLRAGQREVLATSPHALRARPPFSAQVRVQRICIVRSMSNMTTASPANT